MQEKIRSEGEASEPAADRHGSRGVGAAWTAARAGRVLLSGWMASVPVVALTTAAVLAVPHARGIAFPLPLRYASTAPVVVLTAVAAAFVHATLAGRAGGARRGLALALGGLAAVLLVGMLAAGPRGLVGAAWPAVVLGAAALSWVVPRLVDRPRISRVGVAAAVAIGGGEAIGMIGARASEQGVPRGSEGLAFEVPRALFDVEHRFVGLPGGARVHYVDEGQGETLLFLHGNPSWSFQWRDLIAGLRGSYRCVALDYPGFGLSEGPPGFGYTPAEESRVLEEFVDRLGLGDLTLVMQDWGGPIGLGLAGRRPELVRGVILGSTWAWPTSTSEGRGKFSLIAGGPIGEFAQINFNAFASFGLANGVVHELPPAVADLYTRPSRRLDHRGIAAFYPGQITAATDFFAGVEAGLPRLAGKPALVFWALADRGFPRADLARIEAAFPRHRTIEFPEANHFFFEDTAAQMLPEITAFMEQNRAGRAGGGPR